MLVAERESADFYETVLASFGQGPRRQARRQLGDQRTVRPAQQGRPGHSGVAGQSAEQLGTIVDLIGEGTISGKIAKDLFEIVWQEGGDPRALVEARGMKQVTDIGAIEKVVDDIIAANPDKVEQAKAKPQLDRLVRRSGDEVIRRQGQSASRQRSAQVQTRHLMSVRHQPALSRSASVEARACTNRSS